MSRATAKREGEAAEAAVIQRVPELAPLPDVEHADAEATHAIEPSEDCPMVGLAVVEQGTRVEIKSCAVTVTSRQKRGRFYLREGQHDRLCGDGEVYLFTVTPPHRAVPIAVKIVPASHVSDLIPSWIAVDGRATHAKVTWTRVFDEEELLREPEGQSPEVSADV